MTILVLVEAMLIVPTVTFLLGRVRAMRDLKVVLPNPIAARRIDPIEVEAITFAIIVVNKMKSSSRGRMTMLDLVQLQHGVVTSLQSLKMKIFSSDDHVRLVIVSL